MPRSSSVRLLCFTAAVAVAALLSLTGCAEHRRAEPPRVEQMHAVWVTRFDYNKAEDVRRIIRNCAEAGFNTVLFQVRGNGTSFYRSNYEPWADELGGSDPGFDPLELACNEAHARNMQLHAWVNVMPAWRGTKPPANPDQLYNRRPEWFWYDQHGERQALSSFYVSLNPCLPEVREYLVEVFRDIVARYPVDGLHLDYIRMPSEPPATPKDSKLDYPRDPRTLALFKEETGRAPDEDAEIWKLWRARQITQLVSDIRAMMRAERPAAVLTAAVIAERKNGLNRCQDALTWINEQHVDALILMNYTADVPTFQRRIDTWLLEKQRGTIVPGLSIGPFISRPVEDGAAGVKKEIDLARDRTGCYSVFAYSYLFDSGDDFELATQDAKASQDRESRRRILLPLEP